MARKPKEQRDAEQLVRQQKLRDDTRVKRRPSRDDMARILLWQMIMAAKSRGKPQADLDKLRNSILEDLERQGFDERESEDAFDGLVRKYADGTYPFRPKKHLGS